MREECQAVLLDYDPSNDDDLERFFYEECRKLCPSTEAKQLPTAGIPCLRKLGKFYDNMSNIL